ncbi:MAG: TetR/AcrR family transcriptional regulator [Proteobacteria bacterium]|nr:TetR/AcrR family transcriptional regulator [Pseudomonadota bacterium]MBU1570747.1 TetR/AcrR family transcriptional regulator [Pseudomonadota bacterium]
MNYSAFKKTISNYTKDFCNEDFLENRRNIRIKKESTVAKNLEKIFDATLKISNNKGFQAMTMRDLSREAGLSMGALYSYFSCKEDLLKRLQSQRRSVTKRILEEYINRETGIVDKLRTAIRIHLYLSEAMQPWFYFSYMETKNISGPEQAKAIESELYTEKIFEQILNEGEKARVFIHKNNQLTASIIKAMLQDWYLKRWKYAKRNISVEKYAKYLISIIEIFCLSPEYEKKCKNKE